MVEFRKIIQFGKSSQIISLPKTWTNRHELKAGDSVRVEQLQDVMIISPSNNEAVLKPKECVYHVDNDDISTIKRKILFAYLNNCDYITLKGKNLSEKSKVIREMMHQLVALEIIEETTEKLQAKCYVNMQDINITQLVRKIDAILKSMLIDLVEHTKKPEEFNGLNLANNLSKRDGDVNRLSFLVMKTIKHALAFPHQHPNIGKQENLLEYWDGVQTLEKLGDHIKRLARLINELPKPSAHALILIIEDVHKHYDQIMKARYKRDFATIHKLAAKRSKFTEAFDQYQEQHETSIAAAKSMRFARELFHRVDKLTAIYD